MTFHFPRATHAIKALPVLAAAMALSVLIPAAPAGASGFSNTGIVAPTPAGMLAVWKPDLIVSGSAQPLEAYDYGNTYRVTIRVQNTGNAQSGQTLVSIWDHGNQAWLSVPALAPSGYAVLGYTAQRVYPGGDCSIVLTVDPTYLVAEFNEYNNSSTVTLNSPYAC